MTEILNSLLKSTPLQLALIAIIGLVLVIAGPAGRKLARALERHKTMTTSTKIDGTDIVALIEDGKSPLPRQWATWVDERIEHKLRNVLGTVNLHMEITEQKLAGLAPIDLKLDDVQQRLARIEGMLDRRSQPR